MKTPTKPDHRNADQRSSLQRLDVRLKHRRLSGLKSSYEIKRAQRIGAKS